jgi:hypothetical protein
MPQIKRGQIVKFHTPLPDEDPNLLYVVLEAHYDVDIPRARIKALDTGFAFPPINVVRAGELEVVEIDCEQITTLY